VTTTAATSDALAARRAEVLATLQAASVDGVHVGRILAWEVEGTAVRLRTALDGLATFVETLTLRDVDGEALAPDVSDARVRGALDVLALTTSLSYLKATLPARVEVEVPLGPAAHRMLEALLVDGLAELAFVNGLGPLDDAFTLHGSVEADEASGSVTTGSGAEVPPGVLVTVGGGKDSAVSLALAARHDPGALAVSVNPREPMRTTAAWAGVGLVSIERQLDPQLIALNAAGAINGHVPITAIVTSLAALAAAVLGRGTVLVSNEASADEPTRTVGTWRINHQYSKTSAFERLLGAALDEAGAQVRIVSLVRPLSELAIARLAARLPGLVASVTSCNAAYSLSAPRPGWCGACPKCRFVELALAPFTERTALVADLGFDALADPTQVDGFAAMLDDATKPFECVGTVAEVRLALDLLAVDPDWSDAAVVAALAGPGTGGSPGAGAGAGATLAERLADALAPDVSQLPPPPFDRWIVDAAVDDAEEPA
jgi:UDP-N-acetyl-alpha-D-muramoyl-L-alanyl-L-glutamate epimerase